jgi:hypothetical protein
MWVGLVAVVTGCATTGKPPLQTVSVSTVNEKGETVAGILCVLLNDKGRWQVITPGAAEVTRSRADLHVTCEDEQWQASADYDASAVMAALKGTAKGAATGAAIGAVGLATSGGTAATGTLLDAAAGGSVMVLAIGDVAGVALISAIADESKRSYPDQIVVVLRPRMSAKP